MYVGKLAFAFVLHYRYTCKTVLHSDWLQKCQDGKASVFQARDICVL